MAPLTQASSGQWPASGAGWMLGPMARRSWTLNGEAFECWEDRASEAPAGPEGEASMGTEKALLPILPAAAPSPGTRETSLASIPSLVGTVFWKSCSLS